MVRYGVGEVTSMVSWAWGIQKIDLPRTRLRPMGLIRTEWSTLVSAAQRQRVPYWQVMARYGVGEVARVVAWGLEIPMIDIHRIT